MREPMWGGSRGWGVGGGVDLNIISRRGEVKVNFRLVRGECDLILTLLLPISQPCLQVIIAQSLKLLSKVLNSGTACISADLLGMQLWSHDEIYLLYQG